MTRTSSCHLLTMLAEVPDPRKKKGRRHPLAAMLAVTVVGLLCGQRSYTQIAKWARLHPDLRCEAVNVYGQCFSQTPGDVQFGASWFGDVRYQSTLQRIEVFTRNIKNASAKT